MKILKIALMRQRRRLEISLRRTVIAIMPIAVLTTHQHHRIAVMLGLLHMRGNVLDIEPDAAVMAAVRHRGMQGPAMMERRLSGL